MIFTQVIIYFSERVLKLDTIQYIVTSVTMSVVVKAGTYLPTSKSLGVLSFLCR